MSTSRRILRVERRNCPHCDGLVSLKTFKAHKRRFFDAASGRWLKAIDELRIQSEDAESAPPCLHPEPVVEHIPGNKDILCIHTFMIFRLPPKVHGAMCSLDSDKL